jgi:2-polyprenyl-3-methyl-5-hydroxy-6-metoxy-1,4-benzoquinol methylase
MNIDNAIIDKVRDFWDRRPCNINHSPKAVGTREYFDEVETRKYFVEPHIPRFAQFSEWHGKKVLELGCGIGTDMINFARNGAQVTTVELSEKSLEIAKKRAQIYNLQNNIRFYLGNIETLGEFLPQEPYDPIYSFGVIHHTPRPELVIEQLRNYTKPGSTIKIMVYNLYSFKTLWIFLKYGKMRFWRFSELVSYYSEAAIGCPLTHLFTPRTLCAILKKNGFHVTDISIDHIFSYRIPDYIKHRYVKCWYFRLMPKSVFRWLEKQFGWHLCVTAERI